MKPPEKSNWLKYSGIGTQIAIFILVFWWIGNKLEIRYDFKPWGSLTGLLLGAMTGLYELWKIINNKK
ncbi:MAG: AtpZ/AtpI family protein [Fidelibacterota bacterium]